MGGGGAQAIGKALAINTTLTQINLGWNSLGKGTGREIGGGMRDRVLKAGRGVGWGAGFPLYLVSYIFNERVNYAHELAFRDHNLNRCK